MGLYIRQGISGKTGARNESNPAKTSVSSALLRVCFVVRGSVVCCHGGECGLFLGRVWFVVREGVWFVVRGECGLESGLGRV